MEAEDPVCMLIPQDLTVPLGVLESAGRSWIHRLSFPASGPQIAMYPPLITLVLFASTVFRIAEACSSRSTPKPRPPSPTTRPNITFQTYACPEAYARWYCLNGATCFSVKIGESILYNCECADGYMGQRCEFKDLDGSYLPSRERVMIERASIAGGVVVAILFIVILSVAAYVYVRRPHKKEISQDELERKPFSTRPKQILIAPQDPEAGHSEKRTIASSSHMPHWNVKT